MIEHRRFSSVPRALALLTAILIALPATAQPWFRGGGGMRGGGPRISGGYHYYGGFRGYRGWNGYHPYGLSLGAYVGFLPRTSLSISFGGGPWWFDSGVWYRPYGRRYMAAFPPLGICVPVLPPAARAFWLGGVCYYCMNDIYYTQVSDGYQVVAPPPGYDPYPDFDAPPPPVQPSRPESARPDPVLDALTISPNKGQTPEQMRADRLAARRYATDKTGYDPARTDPSDPGTPRARRAYLHTLRAFLEGRGYTVD